MTNNAQPFVGHFLFGMERWLVGPLMELLGRIIFMIDKE